MSMEFFRSDGAHWWVILGKPCTFSFSRFAVPQRRWWRDESSGMLCRVDW